jgi:hypothetical protein
LLPWFWVFPAAGHCNHPRTGERARYHLLADSLQRAVHAAAAKLGLDSLIIRVIREIRG